MCVFDVLHLNSLGLNIKLVVGLDCLCELAMAVGLGTVSESDVNVSFQVLFETEHSWKIS